MFQSLIVDKNQQYFQSLAESEGALPAPVDIKKNLAIIMELPPLIWTNWDSKGRLKLTNTGHTAMMTGHWSKNGRPSLSGGHLTSSYSLGQLHFHWGPSNNCGSEHSLDGIRYPMEMHVLLFNSRYGKPEAALRERDGIIILVYFLQEKPNVLLQPFVEALTTIQGPYKSVSLPSTGAKVVTPFTSNFFLYWGSVLTETCAHCVSWVVFQQPLSVSSTQVAEFRKLVNPVKKAIVKNFCDQQPPHGRSFFFASTKRGASQTGLKSISMSQNTVITTSCVEGNRRCCISARRKRLHKKLPKESLSEMLTSFKSNGKEIKLKLHQLEELTRSIQKKERYNAMWWTREFDQRLRNLEKIEYFHSKSRKNRTKRKISSRQFSRLGIMSKLFQDVDSSKNYQQPTTLKHLPEESEVLVASHTEDCLKNSTDSATGTGPDETSQKSSVLITESSHSFYSEKKPKDGKKSKEQVIPNSVQNQGSFSLTKEHTVINFVQRNKELAGKKPLASKKKEVRSRNQRINGGGDFDKNITSIGTGLKSREKSRTT